jgi:hypothetical protein
MRTEETPFPLSCPRADIRKVSAPRSPSHVTNVTAVGRHPLRSLHTEFRG